MLGAALTALFAVPSAAGELGPAGAETAALGNAPTATLEAAATSEAGAVEPDSARGNPLWAIPLRGLGATRERPLFSPSRRPPAAEAAPPQPPREAPPPPPPVAGPETPPFVLVGAVLGGKANLAILRNLSTNAITHLREGQTDEGWRAQKVSARSVVLEKDGAATTLEMPKPGTVAPADDEAVAAPQLAPRRPGQGVRPRHQD